MVGLLQVDVFPARRREEARELRERKGAGERDRAPHDPGGQDEAARGEPLGDDVRVDEDSAPDDPADDEHRRVERTQGPAEAHGRRIPEPEIGNRKSGNGE